MITGQALPDITSPLARSHIFLLAHHTHHPEHTDQVIRFCTNDVRGYVSGYWHLRLPNPHRSARQVPDVSASGDMEPGTRRMVNVRSPMSRVMKRSRGQS